MVRMSDGAEILVRRNGTAPVAALAWNAKGTLLAFAAGGWRRRSAGALATGIGSAVPVPGEQCVSASVDSAGSFAVNEMSPDETRRAYRKDTASRLRAGRGGACRIRSFASADRDPQPAGGAGDPTAAIVTCTCGSGQATGRIEARRRAPDHAGARACPSRRGGAEGGRDAGAAARSGRKDRRADPGQKIVFSSRRRASFLRSLTTQ